jgi:hypothetical protein
VSRHSSKKIPVPNLRTSLKPSGGQLLNVLNWRVSQELGLDSSPDAAAVGRIHGPLDPFDDNIKLLLVWLA